MIPNTLLVTGLGPDNNLVKLSPEELHCKTLLFESKHATLPEHVSRCRYHLNASEPPINARLPPELLSAIFMEYMLMCTAYVDNPGYKDVYFDNQPCLWFTVASELYDLVDTNKEFSLVLYEHAMQLPENFSRREEMWKKLSKLPNREPKSVCAGGHPGHPFRDN